MRGYFVHIFSSFILQFWTLGDKPSGQPLEMKASSATGDGGNGGGSLLLQWSDPDRSQWNGAIQGYRAGWRRMRYFLPTLSLPILYSSVMTVVENHSGAGGIQYIFTPK